MSDDELSAETRALLSRGRDGIAAPIGRRTAVRRKVLANAAAGAVLTTSATAAAWTTAAKIGVVSAVILSGIGVTAIVKHPTPPPPVLVAPTPRPPAVPVPVPVPAPVSVPAPAPVPVPVSVPVPVAPVPLSTLPEETRLLRRAHDAISIGDGTEALRLLDQHATTFPKSILEPERAAERVFALCANGAVIPARAAAKSFLAAHPTGPLATRVKSSCAADSHDPDLFLQILRGIGHEGA